VRSSRAAASLRQGTDVGSYEHVFASGGGSVDEGSDRGYTGHVDEGGGPVERRDGRLLVRKLSVGDMDNNVYVIADAETLDALIVDAAAQPDRIRAAVHDLEPLGVAQTHGHWDHVRAWDDLREDPGVPIWGHPGDAELFPREVDRALADGERISVGGLEVEVIHTPGHTDGSIHLLVEAEDRHHLFTGDSLFPGGPGNTWNDTERFNQLMDGLEERIFDRLPDETWVYPGHGDDTTLGEERPKIPEWRRRGW
jgi:glyoxylase-like metal-dependent hydrolase (beta-lactamase superfamily II)